MRTTNTGDRQHAALDPGRRSGLALLALLLVALTGSGCGSNEAGVMLRLAPPENWAGELGELRAWRDRYFRQASDTPLPVASREQFAGLEYWEPHPSYYFVGNLQRYPDPERFEIATTSGGQRPCERYGRLRFPLDGEILTLQVYRLLDVPGGGADSFLLPFRDGTSGKETYPSGRYVELNGPIGGPYVLDFNTAYNPSCAYGDVQRFSCPVTPSENRLSVRIEAGERGYAPGGD